LTDLALFSLGYRTESPIFHFLYGVPLEESDLYLSMFADPFVIIILTNSVESKHMIEMLNKPAAMRANPMRYTRAWGKAETPDFNTMLAFFQTANSMSQYGFEVGKVTGPPATAVWSWRQIKFIQYR